MTMMMLAFGEPETRGWRRQEKRRCRSPIKTTCQCVPAVVYVQPALLVGASSSNEIFITAPPGWCSANVPAAGAAPDASKPFA